jgi:prophage regulatory protein
MEISIMQTRLINRAQVLNIVPFGNSTLHTKMNSGIFPPPVPMGAGRVAWIESEIQTWIDALISGASSDDVKTLINELVLARTSCGEVA